MSSKIIWCLIDFTKYILGVFKMSYPTQLVFAILHIFLVVYKGTGMPFNNHMIRDKVRNRSLIPILNQSWQICIKVAASGIEEKKDVAMHLKQGRWMVLFYLEGELVVEDKLNIL